MAPGSVFLQLSVARGLLKCALVKEDSSVSPDVSAVARITHTGNDTRILWLPTTFKPLWSLYDSK